MRWFDRYNAYLSRDPSRYHENRRNKPDAPLPSRVMDLRRHRFGVRGGAYVYMFYRRFRHKPFHPVKRYLIPYKGGFHVPVAV